MRFLDYLIEDDYSDNDNVFNHDGYYNWEKIGGNRMRPFEVPKSTTSIVDFINSDDNYHHFPLNCHTFVGVFDLSGTKIESLVGSPRIIEGSFTCRDCYKLTSLKGIPRKITESITLFGCSHIKSLKPLWECDYKKINSNNILVYDLVQAFNILAYHKKNKTKNYLEVMKDARDMGIEDYFK